MLNNASQKGFTLIELMIAITLGLLISAAALMIFLSSQRSLAIQGGMGEIQQNAIFGLTALTYDLRHANLDTLSPYISKNKNNPSRVIFSGVIFETNQTMGGITLNADQVTGVSTNNGSMNEPSDQLTIQYKARQPMTNCEGETVPADTIAIQRYYIDRLPNNQQDGGDVRYGLWCDAAGNVETAPNTTQMRPMGNGAIVLIPDAESFKVSFGIRNSNGTTANRTDDTLRYQTLSDYIATPTGTSTTVVSLEVGVVMRSSNSVHGDRNINRTDFTIAGQDVTLANASNRYLRVPLTQVVAIRNSQELE